LSRIVSRLEGRLLKMDDGFGDTAAAPEAVSVETGQPTDG
jgi:hypothetical protein